MVGPLASPFSSLAVRRSICGCLLVAMSAMNAFGAELPSWNSNDNPTNFSLGGSLFPAGAAPAFTPGASEEPKPQTQDTPPEVATTEATEESVAAKKNADGDPVAAPKPIPLRIPIPNLMPVRAEEPAEISLPPIQGSLRDEYFSIRPVDYLVDPQHLLTEQKKNDLARFLEYHAEEARYHIYVLVFGESQEIPEDINLEQLQRDWFQGEDAVLVAYHLGKPEFAFIGFSSEATNLLPQEVFDRVKQYCVAEAQIASDPADQIERYTIELSTRLWWIAKLIERQVIKGTALSAAEAEEEMSKPAWETASSVETIAPPGFEPEEQTTTTTSEVAPEFNLVAWLLASLVLLLVGLGTGIAAWVWRRDSITSQPILFDDRELPTRLGGSYSGGGYVGISFAMEGEE